MGAEEASPKEGCAFSSMCHRSVEARVWLTYCQRNRWPCCVPPGDSWSIQYGCWGHNSLTEKLKQLALLKKEMCWIESNLAKMNRIISSWLKNLPMRYVKLPSSRILAFKDKNLSYLGLIRSLWAHWGCILCPLCLGKPCCIPQLLGTEREGALPSVGVAYFTGAHNSSDLWLTFMEESTCTGIPLPFHPYPPHLSMRGLFKSLVTHQEVSPPVLQAMLRLIQLWLMRRPFSDSWTQCTVYSSHIFLLKIHSGMLYSIFWTPGTLTSRQW